MKEGAPKKEVKSSKNRSRSSEWEAKDTAFLLPMAPFFFVGNFIEDLFSFF